MELNKQIGELHKRERNKGKANCMLHNISVCKSWKFIRINSFSEAIKPQGEQDLPMGKRLSSFSTGWMDCVLGRGWAPTCIPWARCREMSVGLGLMAALSKSWNCLVLFAFMIVFSYFSSVISRFESCRVSSWKNSCHRGSYYIMPVQPVLKREFEVGQPFSLFIAC